MAIDPQQIATEQTQRAALAQGGAPTEMAGSPENAVRLAGLGNFIPGPGVLSSINRLGNSVSVNKVTPDPPAMSALPSPTEAPAALPADLQNQLDTIPQADLMTPPAPKVDLPERVPTPAELGLMSSVGNYSEIATKKLLAPQVLSPAGLEKFKAMGYKADGTPPEADPLKTAQQALDEQQLQSAVDVNELAAKALTADERGFKPETALASEEATDEILAAMARDEKNIKSLADGGPVNFDYIDTGDDVKAMITAVGEEFADEQKLRTRGKIPNDMTMNEAMGIMADEIGFSRRLLNRKIGEGGLSAAEFVAGRTILVKSAEKLTELATIIKSGTATASDRLRFRRQMAIHTGIQLQLKGAQTEAARALQSFKIKVDGEMDMARFDLEAQNMINNGIMGEAGVTDALAKSLLDTAERVGTLKAINKVAEVGYLAKANRVVNEAYMAGLLSSMPTQVKNFVASAAFMTYQIPSELVAGMFGAVERGARKQLGMGYPISDDQIYVADAFLRMKGWADSYKDALKAASIAWETEMPAGGVSKLDLEGDEYTALKGSDDAETDLGNIFSRSMTELGKRMRIPFRILLSADEFFKTMSQRGELYTRSNQAYQTALRNGATEVEAQDAAGMTLLDPRAISDVLNEKALYDTMQSDLGLLGKVSSKLQNIPIAGRTILTFVTAPTNSIFRSAEFMWLNPRLYGDLFTEGRKRQNALGRLAVGSATMYTVGQYAMDGQITGAMPSDPKIRESLPKGWQPYSFVLRAEGFPKDEDGDYLPLRDEYGALNGPVHYVSYSGYDPVSTIIGFAANTVQRQMMTRDPRLREAWAWSALTSTVDYYKEMPTLKGIADAARFLDTFDPAQLLRGPAQAATPIGYPNPLSALQRSVQRMFDPTSVQPRGDIEYWTEADVKQTMVDENGRTVFVNALPDGSPNYNLIGLAKTSDQSWTTVLDKMVAMQNQDSIPFDETSTTLDAKGDIDPTKGGNVKRFDTLGNAYGADAFSLATNPALAIFNNVSGIKISKGEKAKLYEQELAKVYTMTGNWPLTNPTEIGGVRLSDGVISDLVDLAKNKIVISRPMGQVGVLTFRDALEAMLTNPVRNRYTKVTTTYQQKASMIRELNKLYIDAATKELLQKPAYANLAITVQDVEAKRKREKGE